MLLYCCARAHIHIHSICLLHSAAEFFRQRKKEGGATEWPATVLGWQRPDLKLASVMLDELGLEVVIKVRLGLLHCAPVQNPA
eukprot:1157530-Pelagomonas_calceolata.AAC.3